MVSAKDSTAQLNSQQPTSLYRVILYSGLQRYKNNAITLKNDISIDQP